MVASAASAGSLLAESGMSQASDPSEEEAVLTVG